MRMRAPSATLLACLIVGGRARRLLLHRFRHIVLMLDGDAPGRRAAAAVSARLSEDCSVHIVQLAENSQPDQLSEVALQELLTRKGGQPENTDR